jgi:hypothetical protein
MSAASVSRIQRRSEIATGLEALGDTISRQLTPGIVARDQRLV